MNIKLTNELETTIEKYERLLGFCNQLGVQNYQKSGKNLNCFKEIMKYASFVSQKIKKIPALKVYFDDRLPGNELLEIFKNGSDSCLLVCLQVISDIIVHHISHDEVQISTQTVIQENENLLKSISDHNLRMQKLNKKIFKNSETPEVCVTNFLKK